MKTVTSLTLAVVSLVDFLHDCILKGFCFLLISKVQSDLTVLHGCRDEQEVTVNIIGLGRMKCRITGRTAELCSLKLDD